MSAFLAMSMVVQTLYLLADLYWVGRLGKEAIAAVGWRATSPWLCWRSPKCSAWEQQR
jgi:Na+-driven multidrug efflux pump